MRARLPTSVLVSCIAISVGTSIPAAELVAQDECPFRPAGPMQIDGRAKPHGPNPSLAGFPVWRVQVDPDGSYELVPKGSWNTRQFLISNSGDCQDYYGLEVAWSGAVDTAWVEPVQTGVLAAGTGMYVDVRYHVTSAAIGRVKLTAWGTASDTGWMDIETQNPAVSVTPDGTTTPTRIGPGSYSDQFTVTNTGNVGLTFSISCGGTVNVTCSGTSITSLPLSAGGSSPVTANYSVSGAGNGTLTLSAGAPGASDGGFYNVPVVTYGAAVTPDGTVAPQRLTNTNGQTEVFGVQNNGSTANTFTISCTGSSNVSCTQVSPASIPNLAPGLSQNVTATFNVGAVGNGTLTVTASGTNATDAGSYTIPVVSAIPQAPVVDAANVNSGARNERGLCLTIALGAAAASECGDLRIVHPLPTILTMNKPRAPTLVYNTQLAHPYPVVAANVTLNPGTLIPDSVTAVLKIGGVTRGTGKWIPTGWVPGQTRRIAVGFDGLGDAAGIYSYTLEVRNWFPSTNLPTTVSGQLALINRSTSPFGAGWWLAGLEQLDVATMRWVGGDGSTRLYTTAGTNTWTATALTAPDTLKWNPTLSRYIRYLPEGLQVQFDATGKHVATVNRLQHATTFAYDGCGRLSTITLPPNGAGIYTFTYASPTDCTTRLVSITAPPNGATNRLVTLTVTSGRVTAIQDPDLKSISFGYDASFTNRINSRTDKRGKTTTFGFDAGAKVAKDSLFMGAGQTPIVKRHRALEGQGISSAVDTALAYTMLDGARTDVGDSSRFWLDRYGAPRRIVNALGQETVITRANPNFPELATELRDPTGFVTRATYNPRGNVKTTTAVNPLGDTQDAVTRYEYDNTTWPDFVTRIVNPLGDSLVMSYLTANGNREWQQDGRGSASRVDFRYYDTGPCAGLMRVVDPPLAPPDSVSYDTTRCNLVSTWTAIGFRTDHVRDAIGRDTLVTSPLDSAQTKRDSLRQTFDVMDQVLVSVRAAPVYNNYPAASQRVTKSYDEEGNVLSVGRLSIPDPNAIGTSTITWTYDNAGRAIVETDPLGRPDSTMYDPAGNIGLRVLRSGFMGMTYDAANRMVRRIADDTARFAYDGAGRLLAATNRYARITRSYYPGGALKTDTLRIQTSTLTALDTLWTGYATHRYGLRYTYDLDGRRIGLKHPSNIAPGGVGLRDSVRYGYDPVHGGLAWVEGLGVNTRFDFHYDMASRLDTLRMPASIMEVRTYDGDGRLSTRREPAPAGGWFVAGDLHNDTHHYDGRNKIVSAVASWAGTNGINHGFSNQDLYDGIGSVRSANHANSPYLGGETWGADALGNQTGHFYTDPQTSAFVQWTELYQAATGRLTTMRTTNDTSVVADTITFFYGNGGEQTGKRHAKKCLANPNFPNQGPPCFQSIVELNSTFGAEQRLLETRRLSTQQAGAGLNKREEYRYDALGRRVWHKAVNGWDMSATVRDTLCTRPQPSNECKSFVERTVWDGDQVLYEIRAPSGPPTLEDDPENDQSGSSAHYGRVVYTHAGGIDQPLELVRLDGEWGGPIVAVPHADWRGIYDMVTFTGTLHSSCGPSLGVPQGTFGECYPIDMESASAFAEGMFKHSDWTEVGPRSWFGSLLNGQRDGSGLQYRRNRYYDPVQGRFTQEDPIGLAGGLNLYGFAGGDPVTFSDPFGLMTCPPICTEEEARNIPAVKRPDEAADPRAAALKHPLIDPVAIIAGGLAGAADGLIAGAGENTVVNATAASGGQVGPEFIANTISGFTKHGIDQVIERGVSPQALLDAARSGAVRGPLIDQLGRESLRILGKGAEFAINLLGQVITAWPK